MEMGTEMVEGDGGSHIMRAPWGEEITTHNWPKGQFWPQGGNPWRNIFWKPPPVKLSRRGRGGAVGDDTRRGRGKPLHPKG